MEREAIVETLNRYSAALDSHSWDLFDTVFTQDVEADYPGTLHWFDLPSFKQEFAVYHEALANHQHLMSNHQVLVQGDRANSFVYGLFRLVERTEGSNQGTGVREGCSWYDDELVRTSYGWRIRKRTARVFWMGGMAPVRNVTEGVPMEIGIMGSLPAEVRAGRVAYFNELRKFQQKG